ncbi:hypothetical protein BU17DRAFT_70966 [Hysterangium stoloniferum]|nr:hypothetical protein BU17DRAFT_70966 [Hysterangium stoloniferum]
MSATFTARPLPPILYNGPIISMQRSKPTAPAVNVNVTRSPPAIANLQRRPHTRRLPSVQPELPSVSEEEEAECAVAESDPLPIMKPRRRPRPAPLIPPRTYPTQNFPLIVEIPTPLKTGEQDSFSLSPSTLLTRRRSETVLDFPVPPMSATPPRLSPTPSSSSSSSKSSYPRTPHASDSDSDSDSAKYSPAIRQPHRSASILSLRSFSMAEFDMQADSIYALLHTNTSPTSSIPAKPETALPLPRRPELKLEIAALRSNVVEDICEGWWDIAIDEQKLETSERVLSVVDTAQGGSFDVPFVLGSFMEDMSSDEGSDSEAVSDGEGIEFEWNEEEQDVSFGDADGVESSDEEDGAVDPIATLDRQLLHVPFVVSADAHSPSVCSVASYERRMTPPRESIVPCDVFDAPPSPSLPPVHLYDYPRTPSPSPSPSLPPRPHAPFFSPSPDAMVFHPSSLNDDPFLPPLRSRFSSSTLASIPDQPTSFFSRLTGKASSPSKRTSASKRSSTVPYSHQSPTPAPKRASSTSSPRTPLSPHRHFVPASPAISAFSFSTQGSVEHRAHPSLERDRNPSRSSLDSCLSNDSAGSTSSNGRRRPPIPIELFLRR